MIKPPKLQNGDTIGIMSPSRELIPEWKELLENSIKEIETKLQLKVVLGKHVWANDNY